MNREDYLRELDCAGSQLKQSGQALAAAANPVSQIRHGVANDWKWWLPGASVAGFAFARLLRRPARGRRKTGKREEPRTGAVFWVPLLLKLLPAALAQLVPLFLSLRSGRKP